MPWGSLPATVNGVQEKSGIVFLWSSPFDNAASAKHAFVDSLQFLQDWEGRQDRMQRKLENVTHLTTNREVSALTRSHRNVPVLSK